MGFPQKRNCGKDWSPQQDLSPQVSAGMQEVALLSVHPAVSVGAAECCAQHPDDSGHKWSAGQTAKQLFFFFGPSSRTANVALFPLTGIEAAALCSASVSLGEVFGHCC